MRHLWDFKYFIDIYIFWHFLEVTLPLLSKVGGNSSFWDLLSHSTHYIHRISHRLILASHHYHPLLPLHFWHCISQVCLLSSQCVYATHIPSVSLLYFICHSLCLASLLPHTLQGSPFMDVLVAYNILYSWLSHFPSWLASAWDLHVCLVYSLMVETWENSVSSDAAINQLWSMISINLPCKESWATFSHSNLLLSFETRTQLAPEPGTESKLYYHG